MHWRSVFCEKNYLLHGGSETLAEISLYTNQAGQLIAAARARLEEYSSAGELARLRENPVLYLRAHPPLQHGINSTSAEPHPGLTTASDRGHSLCACTSIGSIAAGRRHRA